VEEYRPDKRRDRAVFKTEHLTEAELQAITQSTMDPWHDHLNAELEWHENFSSTLNAQIIPADMKSDPPPSPRHGRA